MEHHDQFPQKLTLADSSATGIPSFRNVVMDKLTWNGVRMDIHTRVLAAYYPTEGDGQLISWSCRPPYPTASTIRGLYMFSVALSRLPLRLD